MEKRRPKSSMLGPTLAPPSAARRRSITISRAPSGARPSTTLIPVIAAYPERNTDYACRRSRRAVGDVGQYQSIHSENLLRHIHPRTLQPVFQQSECCEERRDHEPIPLFREGSLVKNLTTASRAENVLTERIGHYPSGLSPTPRLGDASPDYSRAARVGGSLGGEGFDKSRSTRVEVTTRSCGGCRAGRKGIGSPRETPVLHGGGKPKNSRKDYPARAPRASAIWFQASRKGYDSGR